MKLLSPQDFSLIDARNFVLHRLAANPSSPVAGQVWSLTGTGAGYYFNGTAVRPLDAALLTDGSIKIAGLEVDPRARSTHTGTQLAATISDLATTVQGYRLDQFAAPTTTVSFGAQRLTALAAGTQPTDAVNLQQAQTLISQAVAGQTAIKNPARVLAAANITLSGLQTIDGVSLAAGDRVLTTAQTTGSQNGLYAAQSGAWVRAVDADEPTEWIQGTEILINEGSTYSGTVWRQTTSGTITPGTTTMNFTQVAKVNTYTADGTTLALTGAQFSARLSTGLTSTAGGIAIDTTVVGRKAVGTVTGDGTSTAITFTHNLNTKNVVPAFRDASDIGVGIDWTATTVNAITLNFGQAPAAGTVFNVAVIG